MSGGDITTLVDLREQLFAQYERAKNSNREWSSGLLEALNIVEENLQKEIDARDKYAEAQ